MQNEELRKAREDVESGLEKYSDLYDFAPVGYLTFDRDGTVLQANLTSTSLLGVERSQLVERNFGARILPVDRPAFNTFLEQVFESRVKRRCEVTVVREGTNVVLRVEGTATQRQCLAALTDVTGRKQAEEDRLVLCKLESTGILAGGIAHDFNNLLTIILLNLDLSLPLVRPEVVLTRRLEEAKRAVLLACGLTQQLITLADGGTPIRRPTNLSGVIRDSVRAALGGSRVACEFTLPADLWLAEADAGQIAQVVRNLILNAREALPQGGTISVRADNVELRPGDNPGLPPGDYLLIGVTDRGSGIPQTDMPKIFDPYFSTKSRGNQKGMGLGLTICHTIVQKHGGAIVARSDAESGTTFQVYLPASSSRAAVGTAPRQGHWTTELDSGSTSVIPAPAESRRRGRILVMDDEEGVRTTIAATLERMGHEVILVEDGGAAIEAYVEAQRLGQPFDAVILDLTVSAGVGGLEAFQALSRLDPDVRAIVMSGYINDPAILEPERCGFRSALTKPFDIQRLVETVARVLEQ